MFLIGAVLAVWSGSATTAGADAASGGADALTVVPRYVRVEIPPGATKDLAITLTASHAGTLLAVQTECRCVQAVTLCPRSLPAQVPQTVTVRVTGILPGMKSVVLRTTEGTATVALDVVCNGIGAGLSAVDACLQTAAASGAEVWFVLPNLRGATRNCGCSAGSLGGIEHLAAFPAWCQARAHGLHLRFLLVGDTEGTNPGLLERLRHAGWSVAGPAVVLAADPAEAIRSPDVVAVIPTVATSLAHRAVVPVPLEEGMLLAGLVVVQRRILLSRLIPVDASLPSDRAALAWVPTALHQRIDRSASPSGACAGCHAAAAHAWSASAHAHAFHALTPAELTDACIACHSLPIAAATVAPDVQCQSCHTGTEAHVASHGHTATQGRVDCRSCHDARHDPAFDPLTAWLAIRH